MSPELTLGAALRDSQSASLAAREKAVRNVAVALLHELRRPSPSLVAASDHPRAAEAHAALLARLQDEHPPVRGLAMVGLATLGHPEVLPRGGAWLTDTDPNEGARFMRECAAIALGLAGAAAPEGSSLRVGARQRLERALRSEHPEVRFQAAIALPDVAPRGAETQLAERLEVEPHPEVRENLVAALGQLQTLEVGTRRRLQRVALESEEAPNTAFEAAMALANVGDPGGYPALLSGLHRLEQRDRALEALAALGPSAPAAATEAVERVLAGWLLPGVTRVRAAYALCRSPDPTARQRGHASLRRLGWHPRPGVREAVRDALRNLARWDDLPQRSG